MGSQMGQGTGRGCIGAFAMAFALAPSLASADQPVELRFSYSGRVDFLATGLPLAIDGPDADSTEVDTNAQPGTLSILTADLPTDPKILQAFLYWGGSITNADCEGSNIDDTVLFTAPGLAAMPITASDCYCSDASAQAYDIQLCRADITNLVPEGPGDYTVDGFDALINNAFTSNASFSIVLIYSADELPVRRVGLYDGLLTLSNQINAQDSYTLSGIEIDQPASGDLTWYALEGDVGGTGLEQVSVQGQPGGTPLVLEDALNPASNPMNHTINTTNPVQPDSIGVDIDQFDISAALAYQDTSVEMTYNAGSDKFWIAYNLVGVNVFEPNFGFGSTKTWALETDVDLNGVPSHEDTVRYTIALQNSGSAVGIVDISDLVPEEALSWSVVSTGGGTSNSSLSTFVVEDIMVAPAQSAIIEFDMVVDDVPDQTVVINEVLFDSTPDGDQGSFFAPPMEIRRDGDGDGWFDNDDNCPEVANEDQADADEDEIGDACDSAETETGEDASSTDESGESSETSAEGSDTSGDSEGESESSDGSESSASGSDGSASASETSDGSSSSSSSSGAIDEGTSEGCSCRAGPRSGFGCVLFLLPLMAWRRRGSLRD